MVMFDNYERAIMAGELFNYINLDIYFNGEI
jgi:hypothetical protein